MEQVVPLDKIPIYVRENTIIPIGPGMEYIGQKEDGQREIYCYLIKGKGWLCSYEHGLAVEMYISADRVKVDCTKANMNPTSVLHDIRPARMQADGQDIGLRMDHKRTYIHIGNRMQDHDIHMVIEKGEQQMAHYAIPRYEGKTEGNRIIQEAAGELVYIEPYGGDAMRFHSSKSLCIDEASNWTPEELASPEGVIIEADDEKTCITNDKIQATIAGDGTVTYQNTQAGKVLLEEYQIDERIHTAPLRRAREYRVTSDNQFEISLYFKAEPGEHFYGTGQDAGDCFDLEGGTVEPLQKSGKCTILYTHSSREYGLIWNNPTVSRAESVSNRIMQYVQYTKQIDYVIIAGDTPGEINEELTVIVGRALMLPEWATGF